ncbi:MAG: hypothetical protein IBX62_00055 [Coriobacteriia bacterium]|nr:hypothetical protein [Coriobacteriia bacterium]
MTLTAFLNPSHTGTDSRDHIDGECDEVLWHFVLNGLDKGADAATLHVTFENAGDVEVTAGKVNLRMQHFYVTTRGHDVLTAASAVVVTSAYNRLNLSHVECVGEVEEPEPEVDLVIGKQASVDLAGPEDLISFTLTYFNEGTGPASDFTIVDDFVETMLRVVDPGGGTVENGRIVWEIAGPLSPSDGVQSITYVVEVLADVPFGDTEVCNVAVISHPDDVDPCDNEARACVTVRNPFLPFPPEPTPTPTPEPTEPEPFAPFTPEPTPTPTAVERALPFTGGDLATLLIAAMACGTSGITLKRKRRRKLR